MANKNGTGLSDYIYIEDLVEVHKKTLELLFSEKEGTYRYINLGIGKGVSVLEMVKHLKKQIIAKSRKFLNYEEKEK